MRKTNLLKAARYTTVAMAAISGSAASAASPGPDPQNLEALANAGIVVVSIPACPYCKKAKVRAIDALHESLHYACVCACEVGVADKSCMR